MYDENNTDSLRQLAGNAFTGITQRTGNMVSAEDTVLLYFQEALRYFRGASDVRDEMRANESLRWLWTESPSDGGLQLTHQLVPTYAWNELVAEELIHDGLAIQPDFDRVFPAVCSK